VVSIPPVAGEDSSAGDDIAEAIRSFGSRLHLALALGVAEEELKAWESGAAAMPDPLYRKLMEVVRKPVVLLAARPLAREPFKEALIGSANLVEAGTMAEAVSVLEAGTPIRLICCTVYFDESRMFDLLRWAKAKFADIPFICARAMPKDITKVSIEAVSIASRALGASTFLDLPELQSQYGASEAMSRFRQSLLGYLPR